MYCKGEGVPKDLVHGYMWFDLAAVRGDECDIHDLVRNLYEFQSGGTMGSGLVSKIAGLFGG